MQARLDRLEELRDQMSAELEEWLRRAEWYERDHERFDEWIESVETDLMECLKKQTLH